MMALHVAETAPGDAHDKAAGEHCACRPRHSDSRISAAAEAPPNIILFVADGLRAAAVSPERAPTFAKIRDTGVNFANSHSVFPTITTANASVIATGHHQGDTGDFGNTQYTGFPVVGANNTVVPFIQDNAVLSELNRHHGGNFIAERSIMAAAREKGYLTAGLGKVGPVGIHDLTQLDGKTTIFFDDDTGKKNGIELRPDVVEKLKKAGLPLETPGRAQRSETPGKTTNIIQQKYYRDIVTKVLLPHFKEQRKAVHAALLVVRPGRHAAFAARQRQ